MSLDAGQLIRYIERANNDVAEYVMYILFSK